MAKFGIGFWSVFLQNNDSISKIWLQFGFLFYIWMQEYFIIVLNRQYIFSQG